MYRWKLAEIGLFVISIVLLSSCTNDSAPVSQASVSTQTEEPKEVKGQAFVSDEVSQQNIVQIAVGSQDHTTLVAAVQAAGLVDVLANNGPLTVFAPVNAAFDALPDGTVDNLLLPENKSSLISVIHYHAAPGTYKGDLLKDGMDLYMAQGGNVKITREGEDVFANGNKILATIDATNGVIHVIDGVLLPPQ
ncbi:fasciclin domain-containing protein [bacterium SCSIO 12741]|nr:fasciclin domain-containing protein [bacterium SCSIO 12741]